MTLGYKADKRGVSDSYLKTLGASKREVESD